MPYEVEIIEHTRTEASAELITVASRHPRMIHADSMTYRGMSRNASSSRAIPTKRMNRFIAADPVRLVYYGQERPGMVATEQIPPERIARAKSLIDTHRDQSLKLVNDLADLGLHKQAANRYAEPHAWINVLWTGNLETWLNVFAQRITGYGDWKAQPEYVWECVKIARLIRKSEPRCIDVGQWHVPFVSDLERDQFSPELFLRLSVARSCRISLKTFDDKVASVEDDLATYTKLLTNDHWSPFEHQGQALAYKDDRSGNFRGYRQLRQMLPKNVHTEFNWDLLDTYPETFGT